MFVPLLLLHPFSSVYCLLCADYIVTLYITERCYEAFARSKAILHSIRIFYHTLQGLADGLYILILLPLVYKLKVQRTARFLSYISKINTTKRPRTYPLILSALQYYCSAEKQQKWLESLLLLLLSPEPPPLAISPVLAPPPPPPPVASLTINFFFVFVFGVPLAEEDLRDALLEPSHEGGEHGAAVFFVNEGQ